MPPNIYEPGRALIWLETVLAPLASGGVWHGIAPVGVTTPFIVYALQTGNDLMQIGADRVWNDGLYAVKVCGPSTMSGTLATIADSVDATLHHAGGVNVGTDSVMLSCTREQTLILPEVVNGVTWLNYILIYRIYVEGV